ncbi:hypothetical protein YC2023_118178 [Brassica napus]
MGLFEMAYSNIYKAHTTLKTSCVPCNVHDLSQILRLICNDESLSLLLTIKSMKTLKDIYINRLRNLRLKVLQQNIASFLQRNLQQWGITKHFFFLMLAPVVVPVRSSSVFCDSEKPEISTRKGN